MQFATINNLTLHYRDEGHGNGRSLIFLNSVGIDLWIWDGLLHHSAQAYQPVRYDKQGLNRTSISQVPYKLADHTADLIGPLGAHRSTSQAVLIGDSVGGIICLDAAIRHPKRVVAIAQKVAAIAKAVLAHWVTPTFIANNPTAYQLYYQTLTDIPQEAHAATCESQQSRPNSTIDR